jgi:hypothetical protein
MVWTVGAVKPMTAGLGAQHGYGFSVKDTYGAPFLTMMYETKPEADQSTQACSGGDRPRHSDTQGLIRQFVVAARELF